MFPPAERNAAPRTGAASRQREAGLAQLRAGKLAAASEILYRAAASSPLDPMVHQALGQAHLSAGRFDEAIASFRTALMFKEDQVEAHNGLAASLRASGRDREALVYARRMVHLAPHLADGLRQLAELLEAVGETEEAASTFRRAALAVSPGSSRNLDVIRALVLERNLSEAERELRQAIALDPENDELHKLHGEILAKIGRFDEAADACDRALSLNPLQVPAHLTAVRIRKCDWADRPRLSRMLATLQNPAATDAHRVFLHFAIGKLLDDLGEYREAMRHFDLANRIRGRGARFDQGAMASHIDRVIERYTPHFFAENVKFAVKSEKPIFIVGMPRSGTTLVEQIVSAHPDVAAGEELFFWFNHARTQAIAFAESIHPNAAHQLAEKYLALLSRIAPSAARVTDKQPFNFQQLGLIHLLLPNAQIVHCRRHPVDTCLSMYFTYFKGRAPFLSNKADLAFAYRQYLRLMDHWRTTLPSDRFFEIDYEALTSRGREAVIQRIIQFCGVAWDNSCLTPERNTRAVGTASMWQARQPIFTSSVERWRRYQPWLGELCDLLKTSIPQSA